MSQWPLLSASSTAKPVPRWSQREQAQAKRAQQSQSRPLRADNSAKPAREQAKRARSKLAESKNLTDWHKHWVPSSCHSRGAATSMSATLSRLVRVHEAIKWPMHFHCKLVDSFPIAHHVWSVSPTSMATWLQQCSRCWYLACHWTIYDWTKTS